MKSINSTFKQNQPDNTRFPVKHHSFMGGGGQWQDCLFYYSFIRAEHIFLWTSVLWLMAGQCALESNSNLQVFVNGAMFVLR